MLALRAGGEQVLVTEQRESRIAGYEDHALQWEWRPRERHGWRLPSDARVRRVAQLGGLVLLVADSHGYVGVIGSDANEIWTVDVGRAANPHAVEMLPGGLVAVAASDGGWVRTYSIASPAVRAEVRLRGAHGLSWDEGSGLWALGDDELVLFSVDENGLTPLRRRLLPSRGGHDLMRAFGTPGRLWVTTSAHVYQYALDADRWDSGAPGLDRINVKSVGDHPVTGQILMTSAEESWWTETLRFVNPDRKIQLPGARIYKARWSVAESR